MPTLKLYLKQSNITFSRNFINVMRSYGFILTRKNRFLRNGILLNHGSSEQIEFGRKVNRFYILNNPSYIHYCSNKMDNYKILSSYYPKTTTSIEYINHLPIIAKPINGHHGYGIKILYTPSEVREFDRLHPSGYIYQNLVKIRHEYRFNIFDRHIYQISRRECSSERTPEGGYVFYYTSLGRDAGISDKFYDFVYNVISDFHNAIGNNLCHYSIDVMKGIDNKYYLTEMNSACGLGNYTVDKLLKEINASLSNDRLEKYRVR